MLRCFAFRPNDDTTIKRTNEQSDTDRQPPVSRDLDQGRSKRWLPIVTNGIITYRTSVRIMQYMTRTGTGITRKHELSFVFLAVRWY